MLKCFRWQCTKALGHDAGSDDHINLFDDDDDDIIDDNDDDDDDESKTMKWNSHILWRWWSW